MSLVEVKDLEVSYGAVRALRSVSISLEEGEMVALLGANGAGKTTTLRAISGLVPPSGGDIRLGTTSIAGMPAHKIVARGVAHLPEGRELFKSLTVEENLRYGYWSKRKEKTAYAARLEEVFGHFPRLRERRSQVASTLSGGEQQMLAIARALMSSPRVLLVDELSLGLAPKIVSQLFEILDQINQAGTAVLLVEQFVHMALQHSHRAYVLAKGELVLEGASEELRRSPDLIASYLGEAVETASGESVTSEELAAEFGGISSDDLDVGQVGASSSAPRPKSRGRARGTNR